MQKKNSLLASLMLLSACDTSVESRSYPEAASPSAQLFQERCSGCHVAPHPDEHTTRVWLSVLQRMQMRMKAKGVTPLNKHELSEISGYLQRHAATVEPK